MAFLEKTAILETSDANLYECPALLSGSVHGLTFSNLTGLNQTITIKLFSKLTGVISAITSSALAIPANGQFTWPKPINMVDGDRIIASCGNAAAVIAVVAVYLETSATLVTGLVPRGVWSSLATYAKGDIASFDNSSYLAVLNNTNSSPPGSANWMVIALRGAKLSIGTVTTGEAGSAATVVDVGTPADAVLNFSIPSGLPGGVLSINGLTGVVTDAVFDVPMDNRDYVRRDKTWVEASVFTSQFKFN